MAFVSFAGVQMGQAEAIRRLEVLEQMNVYMMEAEEAKEAEQAGE